MLYGLYLSAGGALVEDARYEVIANNIANVNTPGFKEDLAVIMARDAEAVEKRLPAFATPLDDLGGGVLISETRTRHVQGPINVTGNPFDLAINGEGFFQVTDGSRTLYTRAGAFSRDLDGRLATPDGMHFLADRSGKPITVPGEGNVVIAPDGTLSIDGAEAARIDLVRFADTSLLAKDGGNMYVNLGGPPQSGDVGRIQQKALEASGVSVTVQLAQMITAQRGYEANIELLRMQDQTLSDLMTIGRVQI